MVILHIITPNNLISGNYEFTLMGFSDKRPCQVRQGLNAKM